MLESPASGVGLCPCQCTAIDGSNVKLAALVAAHMQTRIRELADQVIDLYAYRGQLFDYLKSRMMAIAPNLTVGEVGAVPCCLRAGSYGQSMLPC